MKQVELVEKEESFDEVPEETNERVQKEALNQSSVNGSSQSPLNLQLKNKCSTRVPRRLAMILRAFFCDVPLLLVFLVYASLLWLSHVYDNYLYEQLQAMHISQERRATEITYYTRTCSEEDVTAKSGADLYLSMNATADQAYNHQLLHGFTVFPSVLTPATANALRQHVVERNTFNASDEESIHLIAHDNRYSFGLQSSFPAVSNALIEIANHRLLRPALEKILGRNPTLIEMTAITSSFGAVDQHWHEDVVPTGSAAQYARTFGPIYSLFVPLQLTTKAMGATDACPGTHYCSAAGTDIVCGQHGIAMVGEDGVWPAGDGLLMNMQAFHRGTAHTDPSGPDRVMLILSFTNRQRRAESRQLSQGYSYSLRWDQYGHTLNDMSKADRIMHKPWTLLRTLGLFKLPGTEWGIDYVTSACMRIANEDYGFREDDLNDFLERGGIWWIPTFLQAQLTDDSYSWYDYFHDTGKLCLNFFQSKLVPGFAGIYLFLYTIVSGFSREDRLTATARNAIVRLFVLGCIVFILYRLAIIRVDSSDWAKDLRQKKRYRGVIKNQRLFGIKSEGPSTLPHRRDVLIETRYGSDTLAMYEDYIDGHPGNRFFREYVTGAADSFHQYPEFLKNASAYYVFQAVKDNQGRFLYQGPTGAWEWMTDAKSIAYVRMILATHSHPTKKMLARALRRLVSNVMYGIHSETRMAQGHTVPYLQHLKVKIIRSDGYEVKHSQLSKKDSSSQLRSFLSLESLPILNRRMVAEHKSPLPPHATLMEPDVGAWLTVDDLVECMDDDNDDDVVYWYPAIIESITATGDYFIHWAAGGTGTCELGYVRPFRGYVAGQELELYHGGNDGQLECTVLRVNDDGTYDLYFADGEILRNIGIEFLRHTADESDSEIAKYKTAY
ncbi:hypothetical protein MPSEU_000572600 [Mayamaea pseudoterrestris]|nr:hypothetical protein MPSEU_000572600 [Mayamaea pseudoterrestris]